MASDRNIPTTVKFALGGAAGVGAVLIVHPTDFLKCRMQLSGKSGDKQFNSSFHALKSITKREGLLALYNGLSGNLLKEVTYTTTRLGVFTWLLEYFSTKDKPVSFTKKAALGATAGACAAAVGTPAEVVIIRMCGDGAFPPEQRRNYRHAFHALSQITKTEGLSILYRGFGPTVARAMVLNGSQLSTYSQTKQLILASKKTEDGILCHFLSSMVSGLAATVTSLPVDMIKTRIQAMKTTNGVPEYSGLVDVFKKVLYNEGVLAFWKGFTPYYMKLGPYTVLSFVFLEQFNAAYLRQFVYKRKTE
ncbi:hypothetical protein Angca_002452 [Angiostrongylus cantonensis]|nr:hypothetical protein Angca_002452 [Angiostrongylus cantonensis]